MWTSNHSRCRFRGCLPIWTWPLKAQRHPVQLRAHQEYNPISRFVLCKSLALAHQNSRSYSYSPPLSLAFLSSNNTNWLHTRNLTKDNLVSLLDLLFLHCVGLTQVGVSKCSSLGSVIGSTRHVSTKIKLPIGSQIARKGRCARPRFVDCHTP